MKTVFFFYENYLKFYYKQTYEFSDDGKYIFFLFFQNCWALLSWQLHLHQHEFHQLFISTIIRLVTTTTSNNVKKKNTVFVLI